MSSILLFWCKHLRRRHVLSLDVHRLESKVNLRCRWDKWLETKVNLWLVIRDRRLVRLFVLKLIVLVLVRNHVARAEIVFKLWLLLFLISLLCVESVRNGRLQDLFGRVLIDQRLLIRQQHRPELVRIVLDRRTLGRHRLGILKVLLSNGKLLLALLVIRQSLPLLLQRKLIIVTIALLVRVLREQRLLALVGKQRRHRPLVIVGRLHLATIVLLLYVGRSRLQRRHIIPHWLLLLDVLDHLWEVKLLLRLIGLSADGLLRDLRLAVNVHLLPLELQVRLHHALNGAHVRAAVEVECFYELGNVVRILPLLHSLEEAQVHHHDGRRATDSRRAVDVHRQAQVVDHIVQMLRYHEQIGAVVVLVVVGEREAEGADVALLVDALQVLPRDAALLYVVFGLQVQHARDAFVTHFEDVVFAQRIRAHEYFGIAYLVEVEAAEEIAVGLVYHAVHNPDVLAVLPLDRALLAQLAVVCLRLLDDHGSARLALLDNAGAGFVTF